MLPLIGINYGTILIYGAAAGRRSTYVRQYDDESIIVEDGMFASQDDITNLTANDIGAIPAPEMAAVGQTLAVKAVDESGKPTEWKTIDAMNGDVFYVTMTQNGSLYTADKTIAEVMQAYEAGRAVSCKLPSDGLQTVLPLVGYTTDIIVYGGNAADRAMYVLQMEDGVLVYSETLASKDYVDAVIDNITFPEHITPPATATVGQTLAVKAVDETGKPTQWEAADLPSGNDKEWELYDTITVSEDISKLSIGDIHDATSLYAKGYKELYIVYSMNSHATTPVTDLNIQVNSVSGGTYASFPNYAPAAGKVVNGFLHIFIMPMVRHSVILAHQKGVYAAAGIIKSATYDDRANGLYDKISVVEVVSNVGAGSTFTIYGR
jgi:hypothetical protein